MLYSSIRIPPAAGETEPRYVCQNTQIKFATQPLKSWDLRQYVEDYTSGNVSLVAAGDRASLHDLADCLRSRARDWNADALDLRHVPARDRRNSLSVAAIRRAQGHDDAAGAPLTCSRANVVRVKPYSEILKTLDSNYRNRGLYFDPEMVPFTEREYEVERRVKQIIDERSGKMLRFKTDAIILKDVVCDSRYAYCRRFCPRAIPPYWREIWLERVPADRRSRPD